MSDQLSKDILNAASASERVEYGIRFNAVIKCAKQYANNSASTNLKDWDNAKVSLAGMEKKLMDKYDTTEESQTKLFKTQALVLTYLNEQGYKIKKSALSNHVRSGLLRKKKGVFHQKDVDAYGLIQLQDADTCEKESGKKGRKLQEQKLRKDIALKNEALLKAVMEREIMEGKYVLRHKVEQELVSRGIILKEGLRHTIHTYAPEWCDEVGGDHALLPFLVETMHTAFDQLLHDYAAQDSFELIFKEENHG